MNWRHRPEHHVVVDGAVYKKLARQDRVRIVNGPNAGNEGWVVRRNGANFQVLLDDGRVAFPAIQVVMDLT